MPYRFALYLLGVLLGVTTIAFAVQPKAHEVEKAAQAFRANGQPVQAAPDGTFFCEAEEFKVARTGKAQGWAAKPWGENYYYGTFAITFLSRKAFLGAPEQVKQPATAVQKVNITRAGKYLVLARYDGCYGYETQFTVKVEQNGRTVFSRLYGSRDNLRIWAFNQKLQKDAPEHLGYGGNMVWEGYLGDGQNAYAELQPGLATITLIADRQPAPAAKRNIDLIMLTTDEAQVKSRLENPGRYLPLDGWLTQAGDVWLRVANTGTDKVTVKSLSLHGWTFQQHSPYWVHKRTTKPVSIEAAPGQNSGWVEVGSTMDALMEGQWGFNSSGPCTLEFGMMNAAGKIEPLRTFKGVNGTLNLVGLANVRYARQIPTPAEMNAGIFNYLKKLEPTLHGKTPSQTLLLADGSWEPQDRQFIDTLYGFDGYYYQGPKDRLTLAGQTPAQLEAKCRQLSEEQRRNVAVVSLGDEIGLPAPNKEAATAGFIAFLQAQGLTPAQVDPAAGDDWSKVVYNTDPKQKEANPGVFYWSTRYLYAYGIQAMKAQTDVLRAYLPNAGVGANFSPYSGMPAHAFQGEVFKWVTCFREGGMTLPWSEDYIWGLPMGTPQMNSISLDLFRAGLRGKPDEKILFYVMAHTPGNIPPMWRRMFYSAMGHGAKIFNLYDFNPVWVTYTENSVNDNAMYGMVLKTLHEYGLYEDIVQTGQKRPSEAGLWFSETGDIWRDYDNSGGAAKRALYIAILDQQLPLDFVVEQDAADGTLNRYKVLYLTDQHVSQAASKQIAAWVRNGGHLFATAGAGMFDEYNRPNTVLRELMGITKVEMVAPQTGQIGFIKRDLPAAQPIETVTCAGYVRFPAFGVISKIAAAGTVIGRFSDGSPAVVGSKAGQGEVTYCAFLPGLSFFKPAIPQRPMTNANSPENMAHFIPTDFNWNVGLLVGNAAPASLRPVEVNRPLVEATVIEAKAGTVIPLTNWTPKPMRRVQVTVNIPVPTKDVSLSSGKPVTMKMVNGKPVFTLDLDVADTLILR